MLFLLVNKVLLHCCVADKWHSVCEKCFSCKASLQKRQEIKFSHTEWGTWVRVGCQFHTRSHDSVFFSCRTVQQLSHPPTPWQILSLSLMKCMNVWLVLFLCWLQFCYVVMSTELSIKCCCIVMWETNGMQCVRNVLNFLISFDSIFNDLHLKIFWIEPFPKNLQWI